MNAYARSILLLCFSNVFMTFATGSPRFELALYFTRMTDAQREALARFIAREA